MNRMITKTSCPTSWLTLPPTPGWSSTTSCKQCVLVMIHGNRRGCDSAQTLFIPEQIWKPIKETPVKTFWTAVVWSVIYICRVSQCTASCTVAGFLEAENNPDHLTCPLLSNCGMFWAVWCVSVFPSVLYLVKGFEPWVHEMLWLHFVLEVGEVTSCLGKELPCGNALTSAAHARLGSSSNPCALYLRYLIRSDPLAHVPEEPPVRSSSLKERYESISDTREDTELWKPGWPSPVRSLPSRPSSAWLNLPVLSERRQFVLQCSSTAVYYCTCECPLFGGWHLTSSVTFESSCIHEKGLNSQEQAGQQMNGMFLPVGNNEYCRSVLMIFRRDLLYYQFELFRLLQLVWVAASSGNWNFYIRDLRDAEFVRIWRTEYLVI